MNHVTLHFPLLKIDTTVSEQEWKVMEEYKEFEHELLNKGTKERLLHELHDVVQSYLTLLALEMPNESEMIEFVEEQNQEHRKKIERYRAERGWL